MMRPRDNLPNCPLCNEPIELKNAKTDGRGKAVHEECFLRLIVAQPRQPDLQPKHSWDDLARQASQETDPHKLIELTAKLNQAMLDEERERVHHRLGIKSDANNKSPAS